MDNVSFWLVVNLMHLSFGYITYIVPQTPDNVVANMFYWVNVSMSFVLYLASSFIPAMFLLAALDSCIKNDREDKLKTGKARMFFVYFGLIFCGCLANYIIFTMDFSMKFSIAFFIAISTYGIVHYFLTCFCLREDNIHLVSPQFGLVDGAILFLHSLLILALTGHHQESENFKTFQKIWFSMFILWGVLGMWQTQNATIKLDRDTGPPLVQRKPSTVRRTMVKSSTSQTPIQFETLPPARPECKICLLEYTETSRTPRILKECFHTACEACLDRLLAQNDYEYVRCPICQIVTGVNGPARQLPKNYAVLDTIQA